MSEDKQAKVASAYGPIAYDPEKKIWDEYFKVVMSGYCSNPGLNLIDTEKLVSYGVSTANEMLEQRKKKFGE